MPVRYSDAELRASRCKAVGHPWELTPNARRAPWGTMMTLRCTNCVSIREDIYDLNGELTHRVYNQPDWYTGVEHHTKEEWRKIYFNHIARQNRKSEVIYKSTKKEHTK